MRRWRGNNPERAAYCSVRDHAKERRVPFFLTYDEFLIVIAGTDYVEASGSRRLDLQIDRVDAAGPYSFDNVRVVTCVENAVKSNWERHLPEHKREMLRRRALEMAEAAKGDIDSDPDPF